MLAAYLLRLPLLELAAKRQLAAYGFPQADLRISSAGLNGLSAQGLTLAPETGPSVTSVELSYSLSRLLRGRIDSVKLDGLSLSLNLNGKEPPLGALQTLYGRFNVGTKDAKSAVPVPDVSLSNSRLQVHTPLGVFDAKLNGDFGLNSARDLDGRFRFTLASEILQLNGTIALSQVQNQPLRITISPDRGELTLATLQAQLRAGKASASVVAGRLQTMTTNLSLAPFELAGQPFADVGITAHLEDKQLHIDGELLTVANGSRFTFDFSVDDVENFFADDNSSAAQIDIAAVSDIAKDQLLWSRLDDQVTAGQLQLNIMAAGQMSSDALPYAENSLLTWLHAGDWSGTAKISLAELHYSDLIEGLDTSAQLTLLAEQQALRAVLATPASATASSLRLTDRVNSSAPLNLKINEAELMIAADGSMEYAVAAMAESMAWQLGGGTEARLKLASLDLAGERQPDGALSGRLALLGQHLALPAYSLTASEIETQLHFDPSATGLSGEFVIETLSHQASPATFAPLTITGSFKGMEQDQGYTFQGQAVVADDMPALSFNGIHDPTSGAGRLDATLPQIEFNNRLQPANLSPLLASLRNVAGDASAQAQIRWRGDELDNSGALLIERLSFQTSGTRVQEVTGRIDFNRLWPPSTPPDQTLRVLSLDSGVTLEYLVTTFQLQALRQGMPQLLLNSAEADFVGGTIAINDATLNTQATTQTVNVQLRRIDLALLLQQLNIAGLSGSGQFSGTLPLTFAGNDAYPSLSNGQLSTTGGGIIRLQSEAATQALAGAGEQVALMLSALENFHYEQLELGVDMAADGNTKVDLFMEGRNPQLLDGRPFRFNINLTGNAHPLLAALGRGNQISNDWLRRYWSLER